MPKRRAVGNNLFVYLRARVRKAAAAGCMSSARPVCEQLENRTLLSSTWYVSTTGNDGNPGTLAAPFQTIQHAASLANWGDTVVIRGGTYHETVHPAHGGVSFDAYGNENVVVTGADPVTGWSDYSGNIYQASMPWDLGEGNNQVFVNGQMINEARWPNTSTNLSYPTLESIQGVGGGGGNITIYDSHLSGGWVGAGIHIMPGEGWYGQTGTVVASGPGWLTFSYTPDQSWTAPRAGNQYYLYGKFQALDSPGEWYRDNSGHLYLWAPNNANPNSLDIEVKHRAYAFDLSGDSNITLNGINIFAATIKTDGGSSNLVIDHLRATYISQFTWESIGWQQPINTGIQLMGSGSLLENSTIAWSAGDGVYVAGANSRVTNTVIHDVDYNAGDSAAIHNMGNNVSIDHNLIYNAGRCGIIDQGHGAQVLSNTIHDVMLQTSDGGGIYTVNNNGSGSQIAFNVIYNVYEHVPGDDPHWFSANGIFLDNSASNWWIHDNNVTGTDVALKMNFWSTGNGVYNNVLAGWIGSIGGSGTGSWGGSVISGNLLYGAFVNSNAGAQIYNNATANSVPTIANSAAPPPDPLPPSAGSGSKGAPVYTSSQSSSHATPAATGTSSSSSGHSTFTTGTANSGSGGTSTQSNPSPPTPVSAFSTIAAGTASGSLGTLPVADGAVAASAGNWLKFSSVDFSSGATSLQAMLTAASAARLKVQVRIDSATGTLLGTVRPVAAPKHQRASKPQSVRLAHRVKGVHDVYLVFSGRSGQVDVNWFSFTCIPQKKK